MFVQLAVTLASPHGVREAVALGACFVMTIGAGVYVTMASRSITAMAAAVRLVVWVVPIAMSAVAVPIAVIVMPVVIQEARIPAIEFWIHARRGKWVSVGAGSPVGFYHVG